jgi:XTP/dITP diphosphohydrolase
MKLLIATTNPGKLAEIREFLSDLPAQTGLPVALVNLKDIGISDNVEETGSTFEENALLKARYYCQKSGLPTIADDGGFEIDALGGEPGVKSHRWIHGDREDSDEDLIAYAFERMKDIPPQKRAAQLRAVLVFLTPDGQLHTATATTRGIVPSAPSDVRTEGFPYRSILFLPEINKFYNHDILTTEETERYNHRKHALEELKPFIRAWCLGCDR